MFQNEIESYLERNGFETFNPKAVLFDMDGVLFNSMPLHARSWRKAMAAFGVEMTEAEAYKYEGMRGVETIRILCRRQWGREISDKEAEDMYAVKSGMFAAQPEAGKMEGAESLMRAIRNDGLRICVVTGSGQHTLLDRLSYAFPGLVESQLIVTAFDVTRGKPAPDPYVAGLRKCGVQPWEAIVVENAPLGVQAAVAARIFTVAVNTGPLPDYMLREKGADVVCRTINELYEKWPNLKRGQEAI